MRRWAWLPGMVTFVILAFGAAHSQGGLRGAADDFVQQFGGDVDAAIGMVTGLAELAPGQLEALLASEEGVAAFTRAARIAGVPQVVIDSVLDPAAAYDTMAEFADDLEGVLAVLRDTSATAPLDQATMAQSPPAAGPEPSVPVPDGALEGPVVGDDEVTPAAVDPPTTGVATATEVRSPLADALGFATWLELVLVIISWLTLTWLIFFVLWRLLMPANPFLAVRAAYTVSVLIALAYLALVFWPKFFEYVVPEEISYVPYVAAGVLAVIVMIVIWASYRTQADADEGA